MLTKGSILVADDEINLCRILGAKLSKNGYNVVTVHDGQQAIDKVRESDFDVVLLDLILPKIDGLTALSEIRSLNSGLPVIIMTACENSEAVEKAMSSGASAYLNKPFDLDNLVNLIQNTSRRVSGEAGKKPADSSVLFAQNQPVLLDIKNGRCSGIYPSTIEEKSDSFLSVATPKRGDDYVELSPKTPVKVALTAKDAYYTFSSHVVIQKSLPAPVLVLEKPGVIYRTQRRQSPRVGLKVPIRYSTVKEGEPERSLVLGMTRDIGLGGIGFYSNHEIIPGQLIYVETDSVGEVAGISGVGHVLRCRKLGALDGYRFDVGVKFNSVDDKLKKALV